MLIGRMRALLILFLLTLFSTGFAFAQSAPIPQRKAEALGETLEERVRAEKRKQAALEKQAKTIENALKSTKEQLLKTARSIQKNEKNLQSLENKIQTLEQRQSILQNKLSDDRKSIARLILALERIRRLPPEALIAKPGAPLKTAQSAMLMGDILPALNAQAENLRRNLEALKIISETLEKERDKALETSKSLRHEHALLSSLLARREKLYASTREDIEEQQRESQRISRQAQNLRDLVKKLNAAKRPVKETPRKEQIETTQKNTPPPNPGHPQLPVSGLIRIAYNQPDDLGAPSQGLTIESRPGALIVAPMGGTVRFAGPFRNYGNMIILEHEKGFHSLIAGFQKIDTVVGQNVSAGEPLGLLNDGVKDRRPTLYYELRQNGKPVDPSTKFKDLG